MTAAAAQRTERDPDVAAGTPGVYFDFEIPAGSEEAAERLENRQKHIELVALRQASADSPARATVFVPDTAADHFLKKVEQYRDARPSGLQLPIAAPRPVRTVPCQ
jgi:hypothetical protein